VALAQKFAPVLAAWYGELLSRHTGEKPRCAIQPKNALEGSRFNNMNLCPCVNLAGFPPDYRRQ
jgi:hypothetical protein